MPSTAPGRATRTRTTGASEPKGTAGRSLRQITTWPGALPISPHPWLRAILRSREPAARAVRLTLAWPGARAAQPLPLLRPGPPLWMLVDVVPSLRKWSSPDLGPELDHRALLSKARCPIPGPD